MSEANAIISMAKVGTLISLSWCNNRFYRQSNSIRIGYIQVWGSHITGECAGVCSS